MKFEFDPEKSDANYEKHGIHFSMAQAIWQDPSAIVDAPAMSYDEPRWLAIGTAQGALWAAIYTYRGDAIRIISVRPAREEEREAYEEG